MFLGEAHHCESHHGERITTIFAGILHPACTTEIELYNTDELVNFSVCLICLTVGTLIANYWINVSQRFHHTGRKSF